MVCSLSLAISQDRYPIRVGLIWVGGESNIVLDHHDIMTPAGFHCMNGQLLVGLAYLEIGFPNPPTFRQGQAIFSINPVDSDDVQHESANLTPEPETLVQSKSSSIAPARPSTAQSSSTSASI